MLGVERVSESFRLACRREPDGVWAAPGRVNLIGEHTDYNDGFVLPLALPLGTVCAAGRRTDGRLVARSTRSAAEPVDVMPADLGPGAVTGWGGYPAGVLCALADHGGAVGGVDLVFDSDLPVGAGLSSSASLTCVVAAACDELFGLGLDRTELALVAARAENEFVRVPTGIMDQLAAVLGRAGHVLFIDTRTLAAEPVPFELAGNGLALLVVDTAVRRELVTSAYAERRQACDEAAAALGVPALRDAGVADAERLDDDRLRPAARHVTSENARVLDVVAALRSGADPRVVGPLLTASHRSLRDDFAVSCTELDLAVAAVLDAGAYGARMTGGGFGGCAIALVDAAAVDAVSAAVLRAFAGAGLATPTTFTAVPADGARRLR